MIYLASPYSHKTAEVRSQRYEKVMCCAHYLTRQGLFVYSPIMHFHPMCLRFEMPIDAEFWKRTNFHFLAHSESLYVLKMPGTEESLGVTMEIELAKHLAMPIHYVDHFGIKVL